MNREESINFAKKYIEDTLSFFGLNTDVYTTADEDVIELSVPNTYMSNLLIGKNGDTLRSLQFLLRSTLIQKNAELTRVNLDIADYKRRHNNQIADRAEEWAKEVLASGEEMPLRPMNAAERRVVHKVLSDYSQLTTESEGEGRDRHIVIRKVAE
ncbi:single-stranded DNA-binding protein [Candidatus Saccharibacteria bacterium]|nr:single-stranded DNA-binding protein [Candidatus Saccharibacteria bacterium]MCL1963219.1 single-stranded DNA-binding protein [Candidatus Saccharibacteria bacterium]